jgi:chemotaxis protein methyltransferase CheR
MVALSLSMVSSGPLENLEITLLLEAIFHRYGDDFRNHQREIIRRKLRDFMYTHDIPTISVLQHLVLHDNSYIDALLRALDAHDAGLFDHPDHIVELRKIIVPWLRSCPAPKIWISDCSLAEDAYELAIVLMEEELLHKTLIFATGTNATLLSEAREGKFPLAKLAQYEKNYLRAGGARSLNNYYKQENDTAVFHPELGRNITWVQYNVGTDASFNEFELIICRGGLSEYTARLRRRALKLFHESLPPFGILSIVDTDFTELMPYILHYTAISPKQGLYRK